MMVAKRTYPLSSLYFYLTEGCNLACRHCWIAPKFQNGEQVYPSLDFDLFYRIVEDAIPLGLSTVKLTGGEPLLHPRILDIMSHVRDKGLGLTIETNGVLCTPVMAREIASCGNPFVSVSLDGADPETHEWVRGVSGSFRATLQGIRNLVAAGLRPQVIMTLMKRNAGQVQPVIQLAESLGAGSVKFNLLQPTARGKKMHETDEVLSIEDMIELGRLIENELAVAALVPLFYSHPLAFRSLGKMFGDHGGDCGVCGIFGILGVLSNGVYALCGIGQTVPELAFGHAAEARLDQVWNESPILRQIRDGLPDRLEGICGQCLMKTRCLGSCIAQNYYRKGSLWAGHWYCDAAAEKGLFPASRVRPAEPCSGLGTPSRESHEGMQLAFGG